MQQRQHQLLVLYMLLGINGSERTVDYNEGKKITFSFVKKRDW